jgi:zinc protease
MRIFNVLLLLCLPLTMVAQEYDLNAPLPVNQDVRIGKLSNGLTYYIQKNKLPEKRVELRLAINAGSILEDDDQQGLAHFTEHMAFNGSKHFEKNGLVSYLQSVGVKFGVNLNAYTSFDETVYRILVPTEKPQVVDSAFFVLEDWAHNLSFDPQEIEKERGVILSEWRIGLGAAQRFREIYYPVLFWGSQYGKRMPIGKQEVIENFKPERLISFYKEWYRPDLMAVIVVGDIDVDQYEAIIKKHFEGIPAAKNVRPRTMFPVPDYKGTLYSVSTDKEATQTNVYIYMKTTRKEDRQLNDYREFVKDKIYYFMVNQRMGELSRSAKPPFDYAKSGFEPYARTKDAFSVSMRVKDNGVEEGLTAAMTVLERAKRFGFTDSELERAKKSITLMYDKAVAEKDKTSSDEVASELIRNFLAKEAIPGIAFEANFAKAQLPGISLDEMNKFDDDFLVDSNRVVIVTGPDKVGVTIPTEQRLREIMASVEKLDLKPYVDNSKKFEWPGKQPMSGSIVKQSLDAGLTKLTLSNGVNVWLKPTDFKNNEVYMVAISPGGHSLVADSDYYSAVYASSLIGESGIANLNKNDMVKAFTGKTVSVKPFLNSTTEGITSDGSPKDLDVLFQLTYLYFTQTKIDSAATALFIEKTKESMQSLKINPARVFSNEVIKLMTGNHPRGGGIPSDADLDKINWKRSESILHERFANAADFKFIIVGAFDPESIKPYLEKYIASLPSSNVREKAKDLSIRPPKGLATKEVFKGKDQKCTVQMTYTGAIPVSLENNYLLKSMNDALTIKLTETLREKMSGTYSVRSRGSLNKVPYTNYVETISFQCTPGMADTLIKAAQKEIEKIRTFGVEPADLNKVKLAQKNQCDLNLKDNAFWTQELTNDLMELNKIPTPADYSRLIEKLTSVQIQKMAKKVFGKNYIQAVLLPEK